MKIEKKTWPELFEKILSGEKNFDLRLNDFVCNPGDIIIFREWDPKVKDYTGRKIEREAGFILKTKDINFWPREDAEKYGYQIISLK
jgi:hypothetical protein